MAETAQTMTEFTYAPGEKNIVGDRFSPSVIIFWLKTSIAASSTRVLIQQQMLANQQTQAAQQTQAPSQADQTQQSE